MELIHALRLDPVMDPVQVAFVGAGGKTTAIFQCAQELTGPVLVTATTHLSVNQLDLGDQHYFVSESLLDQLADHIPPGSTLLTGPLTSDSARTQGVSGKFLGRIHSLSKNLRIPLLIEADGSRQLPLKAPANHEPPIPKFVDLVVVVAGLSGLGKPLTSEWVHRPEMFAHISGLQIGERITTSALARVLTHPKGGKKNIPTKARRVLLLNQADEASLQGQADSLKASLLSSFEAVLVGSLAPKSPINSPLNRIQVVHQRIAAVILAAGESRRFGSPKQLLEWQGKPFIWHVAHKALQGGLDPVVVVCGQEIDAIQGALGDLPVKLVYNVNWQQGQGTSVKVGLAEVSSLCGGVLFLLADQPHVPVGLIRSLIETHAQTLNAIIGPAVDGRRGNPVLFDRVTFEDLAVLSDEVGGRALFSQYQVNWIPWPDPAILMDVDTPEDYLRLKDRTFAP
jgi:molybdenum cofactor cytidylyltransferase